MIDTHCHLLFALDDGPRTLEGSLELARRLVAEGIDTVLCTPHFSDLFRTSHADATQRLAELRPALAAEGIPLRVELAAEIGPHYVLREPLDELVVRSIGARFLLVEVQPDTPLAFFDGAAARLSEVGLTPVFAHPERCRAVWRHPRALAPAREAGALVQIVAPSLTGSWGGGPARTAWTMLGGELVDLLGSDAHGRSRPPELAHAVQLVGDRLGDEVAAALTESGPAHLLDAIG
jgi:protein-tyrosine phosphatase